jgi:molecular chaperone HscB
MQNVPGQRGGSCSQGSMSGSETSISANASNRCCWHCKKAGIDENGSGGLFCGECGAVQPPCASCDIFSFFQCPRQFSINENALSTRYKQLQMRLHPDRSMRVGSSEAQAFSASQSALINDAYHTLKDPYRRAAYLLRTHGVDLDSEDGARYAQDDPQLLLEIMDIRETIEESQSLDELQSLLVSTQQRSQSLVTLLSTAFSKNDIGEATRLAIALKYYSKIKEEAMNRMESLLSIRP